MEYTRRIKELRTDNDLSQEEIAQILQVAQTQYSRWETGKHPLPIEHLRTLCLFYHVSADYILGLPKGLDWPR